VKDWERIFPLGPADWGSPVKELLGGDQGKTPAENENDLSSLLISHVFKAIEKWKPDTVGCYRLRAATK